MSFIEPLNYYFYYSKGNLIYYVSNKSDEVKSKPKKEKGNNYYEMMKGYEETELHRFREDFLRYNNELKKEGINFLTYYSNHTAVYLTFKRFAKIQLDKVSISAVIKQEYDYIENCYNAGIMYFDNQYKNIPIESFGYDFKAFYPQFLNKNKLLISTTTGKQIKLLKLDYEKLQYGIYKVAIKSNHPDIKKVFCFSKNGYYTHFSLEFAYKYRQELNITFELDTDSEYNALVYFKSKLVESKSIFYSWFDKMKELKRKYPKNILAKHLYSSLWGCIVKFHKSYHTEEQFEQLDESYSRLNETPYIENGQIRFLFECVKDDKPYKYEFARLKPFLLSLSRNVIGETILRNNLLSNVIRIQTDGIVLNKPFDFSKQEVLSLYPIPEEKSSGLITWQNVNRNNKMKLT